MPYTNNQIIMKLTKILFWVILCFIGIDFLSYLMPSVDGIGAGGTSAAIWICRMLLITSYFGMGLLFYRLQSHFNKIGYLDSKSAELLRMLGCICLGIAVIASLQDAAQVIRSITEAELSVLDWTFIYVRAFFAYFLVKTPVQIIFALFLFLFADFVKRADAVKRENESFI